MQCMTIAHSITNYLEEDTSLETAGVAEYYIVLNNALTWCFQLHRSHLSKTTLKNAKSIWRKWKVVPGGGNPARNSNHVQGRVTSLCSHRFRKETPQQTQSPAQASQAARCGLRGGTWAAMLRRQWGSPAQPVPTTDAVCRCLEKTCSGRKARTNKWWMHPAFC